MPTTEIEAPLADDLIVGAEKIAKYIYGDAGRIRDVYRNVAGLSFFKHGASVAAFKSTIREELLEAQRKARENRAELTNRVTSVMKSRRSASRDSAR